jgi:hypothetical protein
LGASTQGCGIGRSPSTGAALPAVTVRATSRKTTHPGGFVINPPRIGRCPSRPHDVETDLRKASVKIAGVWPKPL